jgi:hypothetical protein
LAFDHRLAQPERFDETSTDTETKVPSVAIIGSFRQYYVDVLAAIAAFRQAGWAVASPAGTDIVNPDIDFVRFTTDANHLDDAQVQTVTLDKIFSADLTYVVAPDGYVGRTTCYEIGRLVQAKRPVYFSSIPRDLPLHVPSQFVLSAEQLIRSLAGNKRPRWLFDGGEGLLYDIERRLGDDRST